MKTVPAFTLDSVWFSDQWGRKTILRGCNLGGDSKMPASPDGSTWRKESLNPSGTVSFIGRPFPEEEADEHFSRIAGWGFNFLRWVITWEAVEHEGPGLYDEEYLAYLRRLLKKADAYGLHVFMDPHQDVWSRWTGGDGAPLWTLKAAGFDPEKLTVTGAAHTHQAAGEDMRQMTWNLNYLRYACATMFTLFFAGNTFAPKLMVDGEPIEDFLQEHFIAAMSHTARRLKDCEAITGFGTLNEPHNGYIGVKDLNDTGTINAPSGLVSTLFEGMTAASGFPVSFRKFRLSPTGPVFTGSEKVNQGRESVFLEGFSCPWKEAAVWSIENEKPVLKEADYFSLVQGKPVNFAADFLKPFQKRYIAEVGKKHDQYIFFVEGLPMGERARWNPSDDAQEHGRIADAFHWYDGKTLLLKKWLPFFTVDASTRSLVIGKKASLDSFTEQLGRMAAAIRSENVPPLLGEFGIPFDLNGGKSYTSGDYRQQEEALSRYFDSLDKLMLSCTIWNYSAGNTHAHGDGWNGEDLSIYCRDTRSGRAERGFCRPYVMATAGTPLAMIFDTRKRLFTFEWTAATVAEPVLPASATQPTPDTNAPEHSSLVSEIPGTPAESDDVCLKPTEIFMPDIWYPDGWTVRSFDGSGTIEEKPEQQRLYVYTKTAGRCRLVVGPTEVD